MAHENPNAPLICGGILGALIGIGGGVFMGEEEYRLKRNQQERVATNVYYLNPSKSYAQRFEKFDKFQKESMERFESDELAKRIGDDIEKGLWGLLIGSIVGAVVGAQIDNNSRHKGE
jgi:hypothetical protein